MDIHQVKEKPRPLAGPHSLGTPGDSMWVVGGPLIGSVAGPHDHREGAGATDNDRRLGVVIFT